MLTDAIRNLLNTARELNNLVAQDEGRYEAWVHESDALEDACVLMDNSLERETIETADNQHKLAVFAFHVSTLVRAEAGKKFGLSFWGGVYVDVEVEPTHDGKDDPTWNSYSFTVSGKREQVGNFAGAYKRYAELCAPAFALHDWSRSK